MLKNKSWIVTGCAALVLWGCGYPATQLTPEEKRSDMEWIFSVFERNYAPADWKKQNLGVDFKVTKEGCLASAMETKTNDEFFATANLCVRKFADAHTRLSMNGALLPETLYVSYLGFLTGRTKYTLTDTDVNAGLGGAVGDTVNALIVTRFLPTYNNTQFHIVANDVIVGVNGMNINDYLTRELIPQVDLGQPESSLSLASRYFALRTSDSMSLPTAETIRLNIRRNGMPMEITLPWLKKDQVDFMREQRAAAQAAAEAKTKASEQTAQLRRKLSIEPGSYVDLGRWMNLLLAPETVGKRAKLLLENTFVRAEFQPTLATLRSIMATGATEDTARPLPTSTLPIQPIVVATWPFPAVVFPYDATGQLQFIGYVRIPSFSFGDEEVVEFERLIAQFNTFKVKGLIIDTIDNGGGSLIHGNRVLNTLSSKQLNFSTLQVRLNDNWVNSFKSQAAFGSNDTDRFYAEKIYRQLAEDSRQGRRLSQPLPATVLDGYGLQKDPDSCVASGKCLNPSTKLVLLINEYCASMCDIFAAGFRDNKLGTIMGSQSMGAGGNVTTHGFSPVSKFILSQTESLIVDGDGKYLENNGVRPDMPLDTVADEPNNYAAIISAAADFIAK